MNFRRAEHRCSHPALLPSPARLGHGPGRPRLSPWSRPLGVTARKARLCLPGLCSCSRPKADWPGPGAAPGPTRSDTRPCSAPPRGAVLRQALPLRRGPALAGAGSRWAPPRPPRPALGPIRRAGPAHLPPVRPRACLRVAPALGPALGDVERCAAGEWGRWPRTT